MQVEYDVTSDDLAALGEYCVNYIPAVQSATTNMQVVGGLFSIAAFSAIWYLTQNQWWFFLGLFIAVAWMWWWPRHVLNETRKYMRRQGEDCGRGLHRIEADPAGLRASCNVSESFVRWPGVNRLVSTTGYVFVFLTDGRAYTIPKNRVVSGDVQAFVSDFEKFVERR